MDDEMKQMYQERRKRRDRYIKAALGAMQGCYKKAEILSYDDSLEETSSLIASLPCLVISVVVSQNQEDKVKIDLFEEIVAYLSRFIIDFKEDIKKKEEIV